MYHVLQSEQELKMEASKFTEAFTLQNLQDEKFLLQALEAQPQHAILWKVLLEKQHLIDQATLFHCKNYTAWAIRKQLNVPIEQELALLKKVFSIDIRNFHAWNYIRWLQKNRPDPLIDSALQQLKEQLGTGQTPEQMEEELKIAPNDLNLWHSYFKMGGSLEYCKRLIGGQDRGPLLAYCKQRIIQQLRGQTIEDKQWCVEQLQTVGATEFLYPVAACQLAYLQ